MIAIFNQKGGIGKTTTAINLSAGLAAMGHTVVLVDLDSQSNATAGVGVTAQPSRGSYQLIAGTATLAEVRLATPYPNLFVCGASDELAGVDIELATVPEPQHRLAEALKGLPGDTHYVVIDCPPALGMLPVNGLVACDRVVLPVTPEPMAHDGLTKAWHHIQRIRANLNRHLEVAGILLTMTGADELHRAMAETIRAEFGHRVLPMTVPHDPQVVEASSRDRPVVAHAPDSPAAVAYMELARLIVERVEGPQAVAAAMPAMPPDRADRGGDGDSSPALDHGGDPPAPWAREDPADRAVIGGIEYKLGIAILLFALGGVLGFVAGRNWGGF